MDLAIIALLLSALSLYLLRHRLFLNVNIQTQVLPEENLAQYFQGSSSKPPVRHRLVQDTRNNEAVVVSKPSPAAAPSAQPGAANLLEAELQDARRALQLQAQLHQAQDTLVRRARASPVLDDGGVVVSESRPPSQRTRAQPPRPPPRVTRSQSGRVLRSSPDRRRYI